MKKRPGPLLIIPILVGLFLYAPIFVVMFFSFNSKNSLHSFGEFSLRWFRQLFENDAMISSIQVSLLIAAVTTVVAVALGVLLAIGLERLGGRASTVGSSVIALTIATPEVVLGFALLLTFTTLLVPLSTTTVILGHITFCIAYVTLIVRARLAQLDPALEEASRDLGRGLWGTIFRVILPQIKTAIFGAAALCFIFSFDDFIVSLFTSGLGTPPLPVRIYGMIRVGVTPEVNAIATLMLTFSIVVGVIGVLLTRRYWFKSAGSQSGGK